MESNLEITMPENVSIITYKNGDKYKGTNFGHPYDFGEFIEKRTGNKYIGEWANFIRTGKGKQTWYKSGKEQEADVYEGH